VHIPDEIEKTTFLIDLIQCRLPLDYFSNLRLDSLGANTQLRSNFVCQLGLIKQSREGFDDKVLISNRAIFLQLHKLYLKVLNI